ncbi:hypothetical protein [Deinococcus sp.]|uniref:hypothetical protein n=1 Tax=Deinococcus sp. TaxID=47478 RepID=UPI003CC593A1
MYNCQLCGRKVAPATPLLRVVLETRPKTYSPREKIHPLVPTKSKKPDKKGKKKRKPARRAWKDDPGGHGCEIVREAAACRECAARYQR